MANTRSARKMVRKIARRTEISKSRRSRMRTFIRRVETALAEGNAEQAQKALRDAQPEIMRAASKGVIPKKTASRKVSRLAQRVKKAQTQSAA
jgi:small subunit ribosomal protein S20